MASKIVPTTLNPNSMAVFKWSGCQIFDPIQHSDNLQTDLYSTIQNNNMSRIQITTVLLNLNKSFCLFITI